MIYSTSNLIAGIFLTAISLISPPAEALANWQSAMIKGSGDIPLVVHSWGDPQGRPVLLIHGMTFSASVFKYQSGPELAGIRFVAPDLRGHGLSAKPWRAEDYSSTKIWAEDIAAVVQAFDLERPIIAGWSFGGYVAMNYLRHCTKHCASGLVLVGTLAGLVPGPPFSARKDFGLPKPQGDATANNYDLFFEGTQWISRVMTFKAASSEDTLEKWQTTAMVSPMVRQALRNAPLDNQDMGDSLSIPTLFIYGEKDASVPSDYVARAVNSLPQAESLTISNAGHSPFSEQPDLFNRALREFVISITGHPAH